MTLNVITGWSTLADQLEPLQFIISNNGTKIALDFKVDEMTYTVVLAQDKPNYYRGTFTRHNNGETYEGKANVRLFETENGGYLLFGHWNEDGDLSKWWIEVENDE
jgi:hypothetical protein